VKGGPALSAPRDTAIAALRQELAALAGRVAVLEADRRRPEDRDRHLLIAIVEAIRDHTFNSADVIRHAVRASPELRDVLDAAGLLSARRLGKYLERLHGRELPGVRLERSDRDRHGVLWSVTVRD
jgi:hypothetical protein